MMQRIKSLSGIGHECLRHRKRPTEQTKGKTTDNL
jgi:hypothetical protein